MEDLRKYLLKKIIKLIKIQNIGSDYIQVKHSKFNKKLMMLKGRSKKKKNSNKKNSKNLVPKKLKKH
jgi:hypothetical protein